MGALVQPDGVPFYAQIRKSLQDDIANKIFVPGGKISPENERVNRMTSRQGISGLIDVGTLYRRSPSLNATHNIPIRAMERGEEKTIHT